MQTLAIIQARMASRRLPGKVLAPIYGKPMILRQLERVARAKSLDQIVVATSTNSSDDELVELLVAEGFDTHRGSQDDVLSRFLEVIDLYAPQTVVRLTADCPLTSPSVIDDLVAAFDASETDYLSNTIRPTFPDGLDVEVVRSDALKRLALFPMDRDEREHVTLGVYRRHEIFQIRNVESPVDLSNLRWTVDTPPDLEFVRGVYENLYLRNPEFEYWDVLEFLQRNPELSRTTKDGRRNEALDGLNVGIMKHKGS